MNIIAISVTPGDDPKVRPFAIINQLPSWEKSCNMYG